LSQNNRALIFVIFGATGDLAHRKLLPALYALQAEGHLPGGLKVFAVGRRSLGDAAYRDTARNSLLSFTVAGSEPDRLERFLTHITYHQLNFQEDAGAYADLCAQVQAAEHAFTMPAVRLYFLATAPAFFSIIADRLAAAGMVEKGDPNVRVLIEKPFGSSLASAAALNDALMAQLDERQVCRIDHYLGKEMIRNILALRFGNGFFEPLWHARHIDNIQITLDETVGVGTRGGYYEHAGVMKDMLQNHVLQLLALVMMDAPKSLSAEDIRREKVKTLRALRRYTPDSAASSIVLGQYGPGKSGDSMLKGYREEEQIAPNSATPTFAALKTHVDNDRWRGMPVYLRTGKRLGQGSARVAIEFKRAAGVPVYPVFEGLGPSLLIIEVQPDEGLRLQFNAKQPGSGFAMRRAELSYCHTCHYSGNSPEAYETLILDALQGNGALFVGWEELEAAWAFVENISDTLPVSGSGFPNYAAGSAGPLAADALLLRDHRAWHCVLPQPDV
jgi:glucose-6-phosphate 1-dehydrogenase